MNLERVDFKDVFIKGYEEPVYRVIKLSERNNPNPRLLIQTPDWAIAFHVSRAVNDYISRSEGDNNFEKVEVHKYYDLDKPNTTDLGFEDFWYVVRPSGIKQYGLDDCIIKTDNGNLARIITWVINNYIDDEKLREKAETNTDNKFDGAQVDPRHKTAQELADELIREAFTSEYVVDKDLEKRFTYHAPKEGQPEIYQDLREEALTFGYLIKECVPDCRERSLALTKLEEVVFWANAGVARS